MCKYLKTVSLSECFVLNYKATLENTNRLDFF